MAVCLFRAPAIDSGFPVKMSPLLSLMTVAFTNSALRGRRAGPWRTSAKQRSMISWARLLQEIIRRADDELQILSSGSVLSFFVRIGVKARSC